MRTGQLLVVSERLRELAEEAGTKASWIESVHVAACPRDLSREGKPDVHLVVRLNVLADQLTAGDDQVELLVSERVTDLAQLKATIDR